MNDEKSEPRHPLIKYSKPIVSGFAVLTLLFAFFAQQFEIDASAETLLVKDNALYIESKAISQRFSPDEFILLGFKPESGDVFSSESLEVLQSISEEISRLDRVTTINSPISVPLLSQADGFSTELNANQFTWLEQRYDATTLRDIFTEHPIYTDLLVNADLSAVAMQIVFEPDSELREFEAQILQLEQQSLASNLDDSEQRRLEELRDQASAINKTLGETRSNEIETIYAIIADHQDAGSFYLGGGYVLAEHLIEIIQNDLLVFGSAIVFIVCALLLVLFRQWQWVGIPIICCLVSVVLTTGAFGLLGLKTTVISSNFIALQLILTLALVIHLIVQYQVLAQASDGKGHEELLVETIRKKVKPCLYAGLTTSVGFGSLVFSNIQPVVTFGWMMIVAMLTSITVSLFLFPSILALGNTVLKHERHGLSESILKRVLGVCESYPRPIVIASLALSGLSIVGLLRLDVENSFLDYFKDSTQVRQELVFIDREFGGSTPLDIVYESGRDRENSDLIVTAEEAQTLQRIHASLQQSEAVGKTMSVYNFTALAQQLNGGSPLTEYEMNSLYLLLDREIREELIGSYLHEESGELRMSVRIKDSTPELDRQEFIEAIRSTMSELGIESEEYVLSNLFVLYQDILERLFTSQVTTLGLVYVALGIVLLLIFRSPTVAAIALIPNIIATLFILGVMGLLGIPLDLMTITIAAIAMGIAVDDTIHFVHHYRHQQASGEKSPLLNTFNSVGYALLYSSLIISVGFSVLGFSDFVPSMLFGLLTALAMIIALVTDLTLLPVLLQRFTGNERKSEPSS